MFGVFLVLGVAVVGGLIAFVGDRVGMRVGRKRLSVFGLRPKYTSIAIAILTGILTAVSTLGIMSAVSENVRVAVFHLTQLQRDLRTAQMKNLELNEEYNKVSASLSDVTNKWETARAELAGINERIAALTDARERAERSLQKARIELAATGADLDRAREQYAQAAAALTAAQEEVRFTQQRKDILEDAIAVLEEQIETLSSQREYLGIGVVDFATQPIIIHAGEILATGIAEPGKSFAEIEGLVVDLLHRADRIARERGAEIENKDVGTRWDLRRLMRAYQSLFDLEHPVVIRVIANTNTIAGKPAFVYLDVLEDKVIFEEGECIASTIISGEKPEDEILALVIGELLPKARQAAHDRGMVGEQGDAPALELSFAELQEAISMAAEISGTREFMLVAERDLHRAGDTLSVNAIVETH